MPTTRPPITASPIGTRLSAPAPSASAMGSVPRTVEKAVIRIGRKRAADASSAACWRPRPSSRFCLANSTIRMPFLVTSPISITSPIWLNTLSVLPNT